MKVLTKKIEGRQALLTIEIEPGEVEKGLNDSYNRLVKKTNIPGFRKGKAPRSVLEQHIGRDGLLEDALNSLLPKAYDKAIKEQGVEPMTNPSIKITKTDPVVFEAIVPLPPTIKLGDYYSIKMKPEVIKVKKEEIDNVIEQLRKRNATWEPVDRPVKENDLAAIDIDSSIGDKPFMVEKNVSFHVVPDAPTPMPGFTTKVLKMKRDEEKEFKLKLIDNYPDAELAGREVSFKVKVVEVKEEKLPELNDDFAKGIAPDIENLDSLKEQIAADLKNRNEEQARSDFEEKLIDTLIDKSKLEFPDFMVNIEVNQMVQQHLERLRATSRNKEDYIKKLEVMPEEELRKKYLPLATRRVASSLVMDGVAEAENIEVSDADINDEIEQMTANAGNKKEEQKKILSSPQYRESIKRMLTVRKTIQRLTEIAGGKRKKNKTKKEAK